MKENQPNQLLRVNLQADKPVIPSGRAGERILEINLTAPPALDDKPHIPLNLSLVLDRSGSMHGEKLRYVKEAALHVIGLMREEDRAALVVYDDKVQVLMGSGYLTSQVKNEWRSKLSQLQSGASTFLYGGWLAGCRQVAEAVGDNTFNRTLLLTDGLANVGVRDPGALAVHAQELFLRGISTSCFGVGEDYDEHLLEAMANHVGGSFHFLETVHAIPLVFEREFTEIVNVTLKDVKITLTLPPSVVALVSAGWHLNRQGDQMTISLGSLTADQTQSVYLRLSNLASNGGRPLEIPLTVTGIGPDQAEHRISTSITFTPVAEAEEASLSPDQEVMARFAAVDLADKAREALKRERAGDRIGSSRLMNSSLSQHEPHISDQTRDKYSRYSEQFSLGLDKVERKRRHYQEYQAMRNRQAIRDYRLAIGHSGMFAQIEDQSVLIDTAAPLSIGLQAEWAFMDRHYPLAKEHGGLTPEDLSKKLGKPVDIVLGMDILRELYLRLDPQRGVITFSRTRLPARGWTLPIQNASGLPVCTLTSGGRDLTMRLMTASYLSFVTSPHADLLKPAATAGVRIQAHLPGLSPWDVDVAHLPIDFGGRQQLLACGVLSPEQAARLALPVEDGVLGAALFNEVPAALAFPDGEVRLLI